jgi:hypothetical protein
MCRLAEIYQYFGGATASIFKVDGPFLNMLSLKKKTVGLLKSW